LSPGKKPGFRGARVFKTKVFTTSEVFWGAIASGVMAITNKIETRFFQNRVKTAD
jgi:hypothetical protein